MTVSLDALEVTVTAPVASFRNPLYAGVQVTLPCPSPATVGGMLAAVAGGWSRLDPRLSFAMAFTAQAHGVDVETYHPLDAAGATTDPTPRDREFLARITLTVWLFDELDLWQRRFRRPVWPMRLGRSQDLASAATRPVSLEPAPGRQGSALLPWQPGIGLPGLRLQLPSAISLDRARTRWDSYLYLAAGGDHLVSHLPDPLSDQTGQAVVPLGPVHPDTAGQAR